MLPLGSISKTDSNNGVSDEWTKIVFHIFKEKTYLSQLMNLPRVFWAKKSWTLKELHLHSFDYFKDIMKRWLKEVQDTEQSDKCNQLPKY
jgi:hypothetical protein